MRCHDYFGFTEINLRKKKSFQFNNVKLNSTFNIFYFIFLIIISVILISNLDLHKYSAFNVILISNFMVRLKD